MRQKYPLKNQEIREKTVSTQLEDYSGIARIKRVAKRGAMWVALTSAFAIPLSYYRNWILTQLDASSEVVGYYAVLMMFINIVNTFVLYGGTTVVTNYLPKIKRSEDKSAFLFTYALISLLAVIIFLSIMHILPDMSQFLIGKQVNSATLRLLSILSPVVVLSELVIYSLTGLMEFRLSSLLSRAQILCVCLVATVCLCVGRELVAPNGSLVLAQTIGCANILVIGVGLYHILQTLKPFVCRFYLPQGFWRFSSAIHLNTFVAFFSTKSDQLFVLAALGVADLGAYFIIMQFAELVVFIPMRIGQVMLSSFSHLVSSGNHKELVRGYTKLCRILLIVTTTISLVMITFSPQLLSVFNPKILEMRTYFILLVLMFAIRGIGSVNTMLILAFDRGRIFLVNNLIMIAIQFFVTLALLESMGLRAVVIGRMSGSLSATIGNFAIIRWRLPGVQIRPPMEYWISGLTVSFAACYFIIIGAHHMLLDIFFIICGLYSFLMALKVTRYEVSTLLHGLRG